MLYWVIGILAVILVLYLLDREIYFYEATHLGPRIQSWLYDRWAAKYDKGKQESQLRDAEMLARPVLDAIKALPSPLILDLATGTGRFPYALLRESEFHGHVVAVDVSVGMLNETAKKLTDYPGRFTLLHKIDYPLPFPDDTFDIVSCMEALEVMGEMRTPLAELYRILRPGGMLITSRATDATGRSAKVMDQSTFKALLQKIGFEQIDIVSWWRWFDRVIARKPGEFSSSNSGSLLSVLKCNHCQKIGFESIPDNGLKCSSCGNTIPQNTNGVLLM
jgi:ubiquinone/menaquinone biosynthesis C-methylase UbiE